MYVSDLEEKQEKVSVQQIEERSYLGSRRLEYET